MCFIVADFIAILLYYRNFRPNLGAGSYLGAAMFVGGVSLASYLLPTDRGDAIIVAIFVVPLATMTALTFLTRFSPWLVGLGTLLILLSDLLIFRRMGPIECMAGLREAIWLCYFVGEALVVYGVTRGLMRTRASKFSRSD